MPRKQKMVRVERGLHLAGKTYWACATPPGTRKASWQSLGDVGLLEARRLRDTFAVSVRREAQPTSVDSKATINDIGVLWLEHLDHLVAIDELAPRTRDSYACGFRLHIKPKLGHRRARTITPDDLVAWHVNQRDSGASNWSIRARWMALRSLLGYAARHGYIVASPADRLTRRERPKTGSSRQRYLTEAEMKRLLAAASHRMPRRQGQAWGGVRWRLAIAIALFTGMRISEVLGLVWGDVDFDGQWVRVRYQIDSKGKRVELKTDRSRRDIVLVGALALMLRKARLASPWSTDGDPVIATATGTSVSRRNLSRAFTNATTKAKLEDVTFHALRHTFASSLIAQGRHVEFVSQQLGHADASITWRTYVHLFNAADQAAAARTDMDDAYGYLLRDQAGAKQ